MTVSRVSFDPTKNYLEVQFNEDEPLLDSEVNELQKIRRFFEMDANQKLFGASYAGDDWLVQPSTLLNTILVKAGTFFYGGYQFVLYQDNLIGGLSTPVTSRVDTVYVLFSETVVTSQQDPNIVDPAVGFETSQRICLSFTILVAEGTSIPMPPQGYGYFQIATLNRVANQSGITAAMIQDDRSSQVHTYVLNGLQVISGVGGPFNVTVNPGVARVADKDIYLTVSPAETTLPQNSVTYAIMQSPETVQFVQTLPTSFKVVLAEIVTNTNGIVVLQQGIAGTTLAESGTISGLPLTSNFGIGQLIFGAGIPLQSYITDIINSTTVQMNNVANDSITDSITFAPGITDLRVFQPLIYKSEVEAESSTLPSVTGAAAVFEVIGSGGLSGVSSYLAGEVIPQYSVVYTSMTSDVVMLADNTTSATAPVIAMAMTAASSNCEGTFLKQGQITNPGWITENGGLGWLLGMPIFLGNGGGMTQKPPTAPYTMIQVVAQPITSTTIEFNPRDTVRN